MKGKQRIVELLASFVFGGGVVALGYELVGARSNDAPAEIAAPVAQAAVVPVSKPLDVDAPTPAPSSVAASASAPSEALPEIHAPSLPFGSLEEATFPKHGLVTSLAVVVRERPDTQSPISGILRLGARVRTSGEPVFGGGCAKGWYGLFPAGWLCRDAGLVVSQQPPDVALSMTVPPPAIDAALPYEYWRVKDEMTPFFHRLPSFTEQDRADVAAIAWFEKRGREPMPLDPDKRPADVPAVVKEYLNAGFYVTRAADEVKSQRRFVRTTRGAYARKYQLQARESPQFRGRVLAGVQDLPLHFIVRELPLMKREEPGSDVLLKTETVPPRLSSYAFVRRVHIGAKEYYEDADGLLMRAYAVGRAYKLKRPAGISLDEAWVHVDLSEQVLVAYRGDTPVYATLVSTGKTPGMTPVGIFRVQSKHIATSMRDQPPEDEAYSIEDVPWTQYFQGNVAMHGAFWHAGFGLVRSHGCVNLSPWDARWLFGFTAPALPSGWHAVSAGVRPHGSGSAVVITE